MDVPAGSVGLLPDHRLPPEDPRVPAGRRSGLLPGGSRRSHDPASFSRRSSETRFPFQTSPNIALEAHAVRAGDWNGMTCMLFQRPSPERTPGQDRQLTFKCNMTGSFSSLLHKVSSWVLLRVLLRVPAPTAVGVAPA